MNKKVLITNAKGQQIEADVVTAFTLKENNKDYIVYTFGEKNGDASKLYTSRIREENGQYFFDAMHLKLYFQVNHYHHCHLQKESQSLD